MALLTAFLKDGRDVLGESHRRRGGGLLGHRLLGRRVKEKYRYRADPGTRTRLPKRALFIRGLSCEFTTTWPHS